MESFRHVWGRDKMTIISQMTLSNAFFLNENFWINIRFVLKGSIKNILALFRIMAWCRPLDMQLSETMMVWLLTHLCVPQAQWINRQNAWCIFLAEYKATFKENVLASPSKYSAVYKRRWINIRSNSDLVLCSYSAPSYYLNKCKFVAKWTFKNIFLWNMNQNTQVSYIEIKLKTSLRNWWPFCHGHNVISYLHGLPGITQVKSNEGYVHLVTAVIGRIANYPHNAANALDLVTAVIR